jgi:hypothetical protein
MTAKSGTRKLLRLRDALNEEMNRLAVNKGWRVTAEIDNGGAAPILDIKVDNRLMDTGDGKD